MKYILYFLLCISALAQQTVNNFAVKTNLTVSGAQAATKVNTVADLRALTPVQDGMLVQTSGYWTNGDGGGTTFYYSASSSASTNLGTVIAPSSGAGRFLWTDNGIVSIRMFGAKGDGSTDDTSKIQATIDYAVQTGGREIFIPKGVYYTPSSWGLYANATNVIPRGMTFRGEGFQSCFYNPSGTNNIFECLPYSNYPIYGTNGIRNRVEGVTMRDVSFYGGTTGDAIRLKWMGQGYFENIIIRTGGKAVHLEHAHMSRFLNIQVGLSISTQFRPGYIEGTPSGGAIGGTPQYGFYCEPVNDDPDNNNNATVGIIEENEFIGVGISNVSVDGIYVQSGVNNRWSGFSKGTVGYGLRLNNVSTDTYDIFCEVNTGNDSNAAINGGGTTAVRLSGSVGNTMSLWASTRNLWLTGGSCGNVFNGIRVNDVKFTSTSTRNIFNGCTFENAIDQSEFSYEGQLFFNSLDSAFITKQHAGNIGVDFVKGLMKYWDGTNNVNFFGPLRMLTKTSSYTLTTNDIYRVLSNLGAASDINITVPSAYAGAGPYTITARQPGVKLNLVPTGTDSIGSGGSGATVVLDFNASAELYATHAGRWIFKTYWGGTKLNIPSLTVDPTSPEVGQIWYRSDTGNTKIATGPGTVILPTIGTIGNLPQGTDLSYSAGTITVPISSTLNNYRYRIIGAGNATLSFTGLTRGVNGSIIVAPASTNFTLTLSTNAFSNQGSAIVIPATSAGKTNHTIIDFQVDYYPGTAIDVVSINAWNVGR